MVWGGPALERLYALLGVDEFGDPDAERFVDNNNVALPYQLAVDHDIRRAARGPIEFDNRALPEIQHIPYRQTRVPQLDVRVEPQASGGVTATFTLTDVAFEGTGESFDVPTYSVGPLVVGIYE